VGEERLEKKKTLSPGLIFIYIQLSCLMGVKPY